MLTERERSPESVERYLNIVRAVINMGIKEFDLECPNPFMGLEVKKDPTATKKGKRDPFPAAVLQKVTERIHGHANTQLRLIFDMLAGTGCRPVEVVGLRVEDVDLDGPLPHMRIEWHADRRVKDEVTHRWVPLVGPALEAARQAMNLDRTKGLRHMLFPTYGKVGGAGNASNALNQKHIRLITPNPKHVLYSLRHNMKDTLRKAGVSIDVQHMILGHTVGGVSEGYGSNEAILEAITVAMEKVVGEARVAYSSIVREKPHDGR